MWMLGPLSIGAAGSAAMMLWSPFYWGLYFSMSPPQHKQARRVTAIERAPRAERVESGGDTAQDNASVVRIAA